MTNNFDEKKLEQLSMLSISEPERVQITKDIGKMIDFITIVDESSLSADGCCVSGDYGRADYIPPKDDALCKKYNALANAPEKTENYFVVSKGGTK